MSAGPSAALLPDGNRLHLQHGPIDLVIGVDGKFRQQAFEAATARFETILDELVEELSLLRKTPASKHPAGVVARNMYQATLPYCAKTFVTPMAAVAGAVADEILASVCTAAPVTRAYVNNGGDIAMYLGPGGAYRMAVAGLDNADLGRINISAGAGIGGLATSGLGGRSLSFGIADAVTVLAATAAQADVAATLIANSVDIPGHHAISRLPACEVDPDSDLGTRLVVTHYERLMPCEVKSALTRGAAIAQQMKSRGLIAGAAIFLQGYSQFVTFPAISLVQKVKEHA